MSVPAVLAALFLVACVASLCTKMVLDWTADELLCSTCHVARTQKSFWTPLHRQLVSEAAKHRPRAHGAGTLVLLGDSITESLRGTICGAPGHDEYAWVPEAAAVFRDTYATWWDRPLVLAIAGDQTQHLLYRVANGEMPPILAEDKAVVMSLLIGTNNLGRGMWPETVHAGVVAVARLLLNRTAGKLLINAVLPRDEFSKWDRGELDEVFHSFDKPVSLVNGLLSASMPEIEREYPGRAAFVDCGFVFLDATGVVRRDLMQDGLHPGPAGHKLMADCLQPALRRLAPAKPMPVGGG